MSDVFTKKKRSEIMSRIGSKNTLIERVVFSFLKNNKVYFVKHYGRIPGKPDIALPRKKRAVFIDGDFWHGRDLNKRIQTLPQLWIAKITNNVRRDKSNKLLLKKMGWEVLRIWEYDIERNKDKALIKIKSFLKK